MSTQSRWFLVLIPNLVLLMAQGIPTPDRIQFDESYQAKESQVWLKYDSQNSRRFRGVFATRNEQKPIWGLREGSFFFFWSEDSAWTAELFVSPEKCEPFLKLSKKGNLAEPLLLQADYC